MKLKLEIDVDTFLYGNELQTLLYRVGDAVNDSEDMKHPRTIIRDTNGNPVGWFVVE
jgi:hypothetical protein